jgi:hypothetical protein
MNKKLIFSMDIKSDRIEFYKDGLVKLYKYEIDEKGKIKRKLLDKFTIK